MTAAAVGFQCPECVAQGRAEVRASRVPSLSGFDRRTSVTVSLIALCVVIYGAEWILGVNTVVGDYGSWPVAIALDGQQWRLFTAMFLHLNLLHLLFNMYVLYLVGRQLELIFGHARYLALYLIAGLGGSVASYVFSDPLSVSAGASGAIFGLMGALVVAGHAAKSDINQVLVLIAINLAFGFFVGGIDWRAHLGGLVTGAVVAAVLTYAPRNHRTLVQVGGCVLVVALLVGAVVVRDNALTNLANQLVG
jgi:membrane associated rhomboid family serine protease